MPASPVRWEQVGGWRAAMRWASARPRKLEVGVHDQPFKYTHFQRRPPAFLRGELRGELRASVDRKATLRLPCSASRGQFISHTTAPLVADRRSLPPLQLTRSLSARCTTTHRCARAVRAFAPPARWPVYYRRFRRVAKPPAARERLELSHLASARGVHTRQLPQDSASCSFGQFVPVPVVSKLGGSTR